MGTAVTRCSPHGGALAVSREVGTDGAELSLATGPAHISQGISAICSVLRHPYLPSQAAKRVGDQSTDPSTLHTCVPQHPHCPHRASPPPTLQHRPQTPQILYHEQIPSPKSLLWDHPAAPELGPGPCAPKSSRHRDERSFPWHPQSPEPLQGEGWVCLPAACMESTTSSLSVLQKLRVSAFLDTGGKCIFPPGANSTASGALELGVLWLCGHICHQPWV